MNVLIACEYSGIVRDEFCKKGVNAYSCDILPTESEYTKEKNKHIQDDVLNVINFGWDMIIAFPPCTDLSNAQAGPRMNEKIKNGKAAASLEFIKKIYNACNKVCIENPVSSYLNNNWIPYSQIIQPYYFGHNYNKKTCLWLKNIPILISTIYNEPKYNFIDSSRNKLKSVHRNVHKRNKFHLGIAQAMAEQWLY